MSKMQHAETLAPIVQQTLSQIHQEANRIDGTDDDETLWSATAQNMLSEFIETLQVQCGWITR